MTDRYLALTSRVFRLCILFQRVLVGKISHAIIVKLTNVVLQLVLNIVSYGTCGKIALVSHAWVDTLKRTAAHFQSSRGEFVVM